MRVVKNQYGTEISYDTIRRGMKRKPHTMSFRSQHADKVMKILSQGIDDKNENCFDTNRGDFIKQQGEYVEVGLSEESLPIFCRRLYEQNDNDTKQIGSTIIWNLGICEIMGK